MSEYKVKAPKKLIEVALPLKEINEACVREKSIRHGHPSTLHLWWARRPLAAARAVLFAQLVNDPGWDEELKIGYKRKADANRERERLFGIIRELVKWENTNNEQVLNIAREEIRKSWRVTCELNKDHPDASELFNPAKLPAFHDPFAGGGSIPLEAQRLGLEAWASDLNPVAVLINKAMIEIPPKFVGRRPIGPIPETEKQLETGQYTWDGVTGLAEDVRRYGHWVRQEAYKRIGHLYPPIKITEEMIAERPDLAQYRGKELTVIAYIWARTVKSPNPLYSHVDVPLASTFLLSDKKGKEAYVDTIIDGDKYEFKVRVGITSEIETIKKGTKASGKTSNFFCLLSNTPIDGKYIKAEGQAGRMGAIPMAIVTEGKNCRVYLSPQNVPSMEETDTLYQDLPDIPIPLYRVDYATPQYGLNLYRDLFSARQLLALKTFSFLVCGIFLNNDPVDNVVLLDHIEELDVNKTRELDYNQAISVYLALCVDKCADYWSTIASWINVRDTVRSTFGRQAITMTWDYVEVNPFSNSTGNWLAMVEWVNKAIGLANNVESHAVQANASNQTISLNKIISSDPPYYDNIGYANLSDFFYLWIRRILRDIYPELFGTIAVPKFEELIVTPGKSKNAENYKDDTFYISGMFEVMCSLAKLSHPSYPITLYYAFKQSEEYDTGVSSRGWIAFLEAIIKSGLMIVGTWPISTERTGRSRDVSSNALSSSIILVCRKRDSNAETISRKNFIADLSQTVPNALDTMINGSETSSPVAPVDLAQAAIGPGMAIYSKYNAILESDGSQMSVHTALILINKALDEYFKEREGDWDGDTNFCLQWFNEYGWREGVYGDADVLARAKGVSVEGVRDSGVLATGAGKVQLLKPSEYPDNWSPAKDSRMPVWEVLHHLIRLHQTRGESAAAEIVKAIPHISETARQLAFLLYTTCERKGWAEDARPYNDLVSAWLSIEKQARADEGGQIEAEF
jgi:putative DNA methylase